MDFNGSAFAEGQEPGRVLGRYKVNSIVFNFVGERTYKEKTLLGRLGFRKGGYVDLTLADLGIRGLELFYLKKGFARVQVQLEHDRLLEGNVIYTIVQGPRVRIGKVAFSGNNAVKTRRLKKAIKTNKKRRLLWPRYYVEGDVKEDLDRLDAVYSVERGFLDRRIRVALDPNILDPAVTAKELGRVASVDITFIIDEGGEYTVGKIGFKGARKIYDIDVDGRFSEETLRSMLVSKEGEKYSERKALSDARRLRNLYREYGFLDAEVQRTLYREDGFLEFTIAERQQFQIGRLDIIGNKQTQDKVIRRALDEYNFSPGRPYNADVAPADGGGKLEEEIQRRVFAEEVSIRPSAKYGYNPDKDTWVTDAEVKIKEYMTGAWNLGGGVSSDSGIIGQVVFEQRNFNIKDWPRNFRELVTGKSPSKGAGQSFRIALQPGVEISQYLVSFTEPYFRDKPTALDVTGSSYEREFESYDEGRLKGYVGFEERYQERYKERWRKSIGFRAENVDVDDIHSDAPVEITSIKGSHALAGIRLGVKKELVDNRFRPSTGYSLSSGYEQVGGDHTFGILSGTYRRYKTLYTDLAERKTILTTKLLAATVIGEAPPFEKFYAGGTGTYGMRGFDYRGVSTRGLNTSTLKREDPIGSDWVFLASAEVAVPLVGEELAALFFVDGGAIDSGNYRAAVGTGVQIMIPQWFGPVPMRFEIATPLMKDDGDDTQVFSFSVGRLF